MDPPGLSGLSQLSRPTWSLIKVKGTVNLGVKTGDVRLEVRINGLYHQYTPFIGIVGIVETLLTYRLPTSWDIQVRGFWWWKRGMVMIFKVETRWLKMKKHIQSLW